MSKTIVLYKDVAPGAEENASVSASLSASDSNIDLVPFGVSPAPIATLEPGRWLLDGTFVLRDTETIGFWSSEMSDVYGVFQNAPSITFDFTNQYSSVGVSLVFDVATGEYCSEVNIQWYQDGVLKSDQTFYPDSTTYFCKNTVTSYDKIVVTLLKTSKPRRYAKVNQVVFGIHREFGMFELRTASVINEMDVIAESLPVSTFKWQLDSREDVDFMFQLKQPVEIRNNSNLLGVYYIDKHKRKTDRIYDIECYDAIGVLDESVFNGGVYNEVSAISILSDIVGEDFQITYASDVEDTTLTGIIEKGSKRDAIQQVLFAWGVSLATDGTEKLKIFNPNSDLIEIGKDRTFAGASVETDSIVTEVRVTAHSYAEDTNGEVEINGVTYKDTKTVYSVVNPNVTANDKQNIKEFQYATLVSSNNAQNVTQRLYDWYLRRNTVTANIVWQGERLGDYVSFPNSWDGKNEGNITKMEIKLSNTVVAGCKSVAT